MVKHLEEERRRPVITGSIESRKRLTVAGLNRFMRRIAHDYGRKAAKQAENRLAPKPTAREAHS